MTLGMLGTLMLRGAFVITSAVALICSGGPLCAADARVGEWPAYAGDAKSTKYSPLDLINRDNVKRLRIAWRWQSPDNEDKKRNPKLHFNLFECTPLMLDGVLYAATNLNRVVAIDANTGRTKWTYDPGAFDPGATDFGQPYGNGFIHRGVAAWGNPANRRIFVGTVNAYLIALDAGTGKPVLDFSDQGRIDLTRDLSREFPRKFYGVTSPPIVVGNVVIVGSSIGDGWPKQLAPPGDVRGFDAHSGKLLWRFHTIPQKGETGNETWLADSWRYTGAANVWTWMSADEELGYVYLPVSTPTNDFYGGHRPGDNLFGESIVCLEAQTGKRVWHFQAVHHGLWDYDLPAAPVLADIVVDGRRVKALAQVSKQAFAYVLDRKTGKPVWPIVEREVPQSTVSGEKTSETQPFPTRPAPFDRHSLSPEDLIDFTPELHAEAKAIVEKAGGATMFTPPTEDGVIVMPGQLGGASWAGAALDPESNTLFVTSITDPRLVRIYQTNEPDSDFRYRGVRRRPPLALSNGLPVTKPPYGRITAIDLNSGEFRWVIPHGSGPRDHPALKNLNLPALGWPSRGFVIATSTLLFAVQEPQITSSPTPTNTVFNGQNREPKLRALDKNTGGLIAEIDLPANATGSPITYRIGGRQFIVVPVGGGGLPAELIALSLDGASTDGPTQ